MNSSQRWIVAITLVLLALRFVITTDHMPIWGSSIAEPVDYFMVYWRRAAVHSDWKTLSFQCIAISLTGAGAAVLAGKKSKG